MLENLIVHIQCSKFWLFINNGKRKTSLVGSIHNGYSKKALIKFYRQLMFDDLPETVLKIRKIFSLNFRKTHQNESNY